MAIERIARAKINLALHVTDQRDDGYHLLDSLVTFAEVGDRLTFEAAGNLSLLETGPFADQLNNDMASNLVVRAAKALHRHMRERGHIGTEAAITLEKNLPVASGIGGGSADAAATLLGLNAMAEHPATGEALAEIALSLGADVPMCLNSVPARVTGIGEEIEPVPLPSFPIVLANPRIPVSTGSVFFNLNDKQNSPMEPLPDATAVETWIDWLRGQRNDLRAPAREIAETIGICLAALDSAAACKLARMSGSGATCFGIFLSQRHADEAATEISAAHPDWWVVSTRTVSWHPAKQEAHMAIDESKPFIPVSIAVLTVSDTRQLADDRSGNILEERVKQAGHTLADRTIVKDDIETIQTQVENWIARDDIDVIITTGGTGFTGRDVTPDALEPLFEKRMEGFSTAFHMLSHEKIGTSTIQSRATAGVAETTFIFCLPGSPGACKDGWDGILKAQLDYRHQPCNLVEIMPRMEEHLKLGKAR